MLKNAAIFAGRNGLDFGDLRTAVLRIPEVSLRIREAQAQIDHLTDATFDLRAYMGSDDSHFLRNFKLKGLAAAIVQVALWDRYIKLNRVPDFIVGNANGDSAVAVITGRQTFAEMIEKSSFIRELQSTESTLVIAVPLRETAPLLAGESLTQYELQNVSVAVDGHVSYSVINTAQMDLRKLLKLLCETLSVGQLISFGPASLLMTAEFKQNVLSEINVHDSIATDPKLNWFWAGLRSQSSALAQ